MNIKSGKRDDNSIPIEELEFGEVFSISDEVEEDTIEDDLFMFVNVSKEARRSIEKKGLANHYAVGMDTGVLYCFKKKENYRVDRNSGWFVSKE